MTPSKLRDLAEAKAARELAEDKPGTQHVQWWAHLLMASIHAMPEEQLERMDRELGAEPEPKLWGVFHVDGHRSQNYPWTWPTEEQARNAIGSNLDGRMLEQHRSRYVVRVITEEPERAPDPDQHLSPAGRAAKALERDGFRDPDPAERKCGCPESERLNGHIRDLVVLIRHLHPTPGRKYEQVMARIQEACE